MSTSSGRRVAALPWTWPLAVALTLSVAAALPSHAAAGAAGSAGAPRRSEGAPSEPRPAPRERRAAGVATRRDAPDCSVFSLEGLRLGMTLDEARQAAAERRIAPRPCDGCAPGVSTFTAEPKTRAAGEPVSSVTFSVEHDHVAGVWVDYVDASAGNALVAEEKAVATAFSERFRGQPFHLEILTSSPSAASRTMGSNTHWKNLECGAGVTLTHGVTYSGRSSERVPLLRAALLPASEIPDAPPPPDTSKVKF